MLIYWVKTLIPERRTVESLSQACRVIGLEVNRERTKYKFMSRRQNAGQNHKLLTDNNCFENAAKFKCLEINQNFIHEEIKRR
jgi:hypothetical protein